LRILFPYQNVIGLELKSNYDHYGTGTAISNQNLAKGYTLALAKQATKRCQKLPVSEPGLQEERGRCWPA
jgi:hypothetical protein